MLEFKKFYRATKTILVCPLANSPIKSFELLKNDIFIITGTIEQLGSEYYECQMGNFKFLLSTEHDDDFIPVNKK